MLEVRWHGRGGQGVVTASHVLATAALVQGLHFQSLPAFGAERSGAPVVAYTRIADGPIPVRGPIEEPDVVVVLDPTLIGRVAVLEGLGQGGVVIVNSPRPPQEVARELGVPPGRVYMLDASEVALRLLGRRLPNAPMLGALVRVTAVVSLGACGEALRQTVGARLGAAVLDANLRALHEGYERVRGCAPLPAGGALHEAD